MTEANNHPANSTHVTVLAGEAVAALLPRPGGRYLDGTFGGGGHTQALLEASAPDGRVLALDADPTAFVRGARLVERFPGRLLAAVANFQDLHAEVTRAGLAPLHGALFDLGLSSNQLNDPARGFSFRDAGPLDMRFGPGAPRTAAELVNESTEGELADILFHLGEERHARRIARAIARARAVSPLTSTTQLAQVVTAALPTSRADARRIHPATRTFQALRIAVNRELDVLRAALGSVLDLLAPGGRLAVISFHSLEDRIVKQFFQLEARGCICPPRIPRCVCGHAPRLRVVTKRPIRPSEREVNKNPRARSAVLRVAERLP